jgi:L-iditol 2-dehydrogenase
VPELEKKLKRTVTASIAVPAVMRAGVYRGGSSLQVEWLDVPTLEPGELLIRVEACGVCNTDVKKIEKDLLPPPRIFGHETAGTVVAIGAGVKGWHVGDRVVAFHHVPCGNCFYCEQKVFAQCATYKKVGITAGYEPSGGGFAEYARIRDWIVKRGVIRIPASVSFEEATFVEPMNTCLKAVHRGDIRPWEIVLIQGQGPIGLLFTMLCSRITRNVYVSEPMLERRRKAIELGAVDAYDPMNANVVNEIRSASDGRGADVAIVAAAVPALVEQALEAIRPGGRVILFAQTSREEMLRINAASLCMDEKKLLGSYSADIDLQDEAAQLVFSGALPLRDLITHRLGLSDISEAVRLASSPSADSLKVVLCPQLG